MKIKSGVAGALLASMFLLFGCSSAPIGVSPIIDYEPGELSGTANWVNFATNMGECLKESGWDVKIGVDNSIGIIFQDNQQGDAWEAAKVDCRTRLGYDQEIEPLTDEQERKLYQGLRTLVACLASEGYDVREVPSEQAFLDDALFDPYGELYYPGNPNKISDDTYVRLLKICPKP